MNCECSVLLLLLLPWGGIAVSNAKNKARRVEWPKTAKAAPTSNMESMLRRTRDQAQGLPQRLQPSWQPQAEKLLSFVEKYNAEGGAPHAQVVKNVDQIIAIVDRIQQDMLDGWLNQTKVLLPAVTKLSHTNDTVVRALSDADAINKEYIQCRQTEHELWKNWDKCHGSDGLKDPCSGEEEKKEYTFWTDPNAWETQYCDFEQRNGTGCYNEYYRKFINKTKVKEKLFEEYAAYLQAKEECDMFTYNRSKWLSDCNDNKGLWIKQRAHCDQLEIKDDAATCQFHDALTSHCMRVSHTNTSIDGFKSSFELDVVTWTQLGEVKCMLSAFKEDETFREAKRAACWREITQPSAINATFGPILEQHGFSLDTMWEAFYEAQGERITEQTSAEHLADLLNSELDPLIDYIQAAEEEAATASGKNCGPGGYASLSGEKWDHANNATYLFATWMSPAPHYKFYVESDVTATCKKDTSILSLRCMGPFAEEAYAACDPDDLCRFVSSDVGAGEASLHTTCKREEQGKTLKLRVKADCAANAMSSASSSILNV